MIHRFRNNGYFIVLDVESGAVHVVDEDMYRALGVFEEMIQKGAETAASGKRPGVSFSDFAAALEENALQIATDTAAELYDEIVGLIASGDLFTAPAGYEELLAKLPEKKVVKALCLNVAHDCNLACRYCFADEGEYHGKRELMSFETGKAALDFLIEASGTRKHLEVDFFGGEPLMNWEVVKQLVAYGRSREAETGKQFRFTLTTNGVLLNDEIKAFANREMDNIVLSLDGRREVNDRMRPFRGGTGRGSYDVIVPKELDMAKSRGEKPYYVRGTFTRFNTDFDRDVLHMKALGFDRISVEPVVAPAEEPYALREEDLPALMEAYDRLAAEMAVRAGTEEDFTFFHFMIDLEGGPCVAKRLSGCGSGTEYLCIAPSGDIYPCHQFTGMPEFVMGNVCEGGVRRDDIRSDFAACNVYARPACRDCFAKYYCSGGCAANAYHFSGSVLGTYEIGCELERKRVECALMLQAASAERAGEA